MPRRHQRDVTTPPLDPEQIKRDIAAIPRKPEWLPQAEWNARRDERDRRHRDRLEREANARIADAIDWGVCCIPACEGRPTNLGPYRPAEAPTQNPDEHLPLCIKHEVVAWRQVQRRKGDETIILTVEQLRAREEQHAAAYHDADKAEWLAKNTGEIYYLRLNGLIKVGWSRYLPDRLKAYGPDVQVLCHYPATRDDETHLHRQLTPYRAKGREWYTESQLILDLVDQAIAKHGRPYITAEWTEPKATIRQRTRPPARRHG